MGDDDLRCILAVLADYGRTVDDRRWDEHRALWSSDPHLRVFDDDHAGVEAIVSFLQAARRGQHLCGVPAVAIDGDRATSRCDFVFFDEADLRLRTAGAYEDELVREAGRWKLANRTIRIRIRRTDPPVS